MPINFTLASFALSETRSPHEDTNYVAAALRVNGNLLIPQVKKINNVNNGTQASKTYPVGFEFSIPNQYENTEEFVFSYFVINHGGGAEQNVIDDCVGVMTGTPLTTFNAQDAAPRNLGNGQQLPNCFTTGLRAADNIESWWNQIKISFQGIKTDKCDGLVVADRFSFTGASIPQIILEGSFSFIYLGMNSAVGCGANSHYSAQWTVQPPT